MKKGWELRSQSRLIRKKSTFRKVGWAERERGTGRPSVEEERGKAKSQKIWQGRCGEKGSWR